MAKFIKTALLEVKERTEQQEVQLEEVRTGETYQSLYEALGKKAGLYGRKNEEVAEKSFSEILEEMEKGFPEEILEIQLRNKK